jgi:exodeoxyribonuclease X
MRTLLLDTETTSVDNPQVLQVAHLELAGERDKVSNTFSVIGEAFNEFYYPSVPISLGAQAVHHIFLDELEGCDPSGTFVLPSDVGYLTGHNIDFDWKVLGQPPVKRICTLALARHLLPDLDSHSLSAVAYHYYGKEIRAQLKGAHNAFNDIMINFAVLEKLLQEPAAQSITTMEELWKLSEYARIPSIWTFGKFRGMPLEAADRGYVSWYRKQPDTDPYLLRALEAKF